MMYLATRETSPRFGSLTPLLQQSLAGSKTWNCRGCFCSLLVSRPVHSLHQGRQRRWRWQGRARSARAHRCRSGELICGAVKRSSLPLRHAALLWICAALSRAAAELTAPATAFAMPPTRPNQPALASPVLSGQHLGSQPRSRGVGMKVRSEATCFNHDAAVPGFRSLRRSMDRAFKGIGAHIGILPTASDSGP